MSEHLQNWTSRPLLHFFIRTMLSLSSTLTSSSLLEGKVTPSLEVMSQIALLILSWSPDCGNCGEQDSSENNLWKVIVNILSHLPLFYFILFVNLTFFAGADKITTKLPFSLSNLLPRIGVSFLHRIWSCPSAKFNSAAMLCNLGTIWWEGILRVASRENHLCEPREISTKKSKKAHYNALIWYSLHAIFVCSAQELYRLSKYEISQYRVLIRDLRFNGVVGIQLNWRVEIIKSDHIVQKPTFLSFNWRN